MGEYGFVIFSLFACVVGLCRLLWGVNSVCCYGEFSYLGGWFLGKGRLWLYMLYVIPFVCV